MRRSPRVARVAAVETAPFPSTKHSQFDRQCKDGRPDERRRNSSEGQSVNNELIIFFSVGLFSTPAKVLKNKNNPPKKLNKTTTTKKPSELVHVQGKKSGEVFGKNADEWTGSV